MSIPELWNFKMVAGGLGFFTANEYRFTMGELIPDESVFIHAGGSDSGSAETSNGLSH